MQYRRFGKTKLQLSVFSLGTMRALASVDTLSQVVDAALAYGINHIETARGYGASETYLGQVLAGKNRQQLVLTTKLLPGADIDRQIDESLGRLNTDYLDCLALHGVNTAHHLEQVRSHLPTLERLRADGRVRHIGFSSHGSLDLILAAMAEPIFSFVNLHYYFFNQRNAPAVALAHQRDLGLFIISPGDKGGQLYTPPERLRLQCQPYDPLWLTYRWLLSDRRVTTLSVGPATAQELDWPLKVADAPGALDSQEHQALQRLAAVQDLVPEFCRQCYACLPCPEEINIPEILRLRNLTVAHDMGSYGQYRYGMFEQAGHWFPGRKGSRCTDCGDCLPRCPEQLAIPDLLRDSHRRLSGPKRRRLWSD